MRTLLSRSSSVPGNTREHGSSMKTRGCVCEEAVCAWGCSHCLCVLMFSLKCRGHDTSRRSLGSDRLGLQHH